MLEQLKKVQSNLSIWELLIASKPHRDAIIKALESIEVPVSASPEVTVASIYVNPRGFLTFSDDDMPLEGRTT